MSQNQVAFITVQLGTEMGQASGALIAPDLVLTASHVTESWDIVQGDPKATALPVPATNIEVTFNPTDTNARDWQPNAVAGLEALYNDVSTTPYAIQGTDFSIIKLAHPVAGQVFNLTSDFTGGPAEFSGYPATFDSSGAYAGSPRVDGTTALTLLTALSNPGQENFAGSVPYAPGASGGPVWIEGPQGPEIVGVEVGTYNGNSGLIAGMNDNAIAEIQLWSGEMGESPMVVRLYNDVLGRAPDAAGLAAWSQAFVSDTVVTGPQGLVGTMYETGAEVLGANPVFVFGFLTSPEFEHEHPNISSGGLVTLLYEQALHRAPDAAGYAGWTAALDSHALSAEQVVVGIMASPEALSIAPIYT